MNHLLMPKLSRRHVRAALALTAVFTSQVLLSQSAGSHIAASRSAAAVRAEKSGGVSTGGIPPVTGLRKSLYSLTFVDVAAGTGGAIDGSQTVSFHYTEWAADGRKVDSSYDRNQPLTLVPNKHSVIVGLETGLQGMRAGGKRRLYIPYQLAYGAVGRLPQVPPKTDLVVDVEVVNVGDAADSTAAAAAQPQGGHNATPGEPSLADTMAYIQTLAKDHGGFLILLKGRNSLMLQVAGAAVDGCTLTLTLVSKDRIEGETTEETKRDVFNMAQLDPTSVRVKDGRANGENIVHQSTLFWVSASQSSGGTLSSLSTDSEENAAHLSKALAHAITLCGGKKSMF